MGQFSRHLQFCFLIDTYFLLLMYSSCVAVTAEHPGFNLAMAGEEGTERYHTAHQRFAIQVHLLYQRLTTMGRCVKLVLVLNGGLILPG